MYYTLHSHHSIIHKMELFYDRIFATTVKKLWYNWNDKKLSNISLTIHFWILLIFINSCADNKLL